MGSEVEVGNFVLAIAGGKVVVGSGSGNSDDKAADRGNQGHGDTRSNDGKVCRAVLTNLEEGNHDAPHRTQEAEERGQVGTGRQEAQVLVFVEAQAFDGTLDGVFQKGSTMLDGVVAHEVTELGGFLEHFGRQAAQSTVVGRLAKALQLHKLRYRAELAEELGVRALVFLILEVLDNHDSPGSEGHDGQDAKDNDGRDIGLRHHLENRDRIVQKDLRK